MIYFIQQGGATGPVKIGYSGSYEGAFRRLRTLQTGNPKPLGVWAVIPGKREDEESLHRLLDAYRLHGEWFEWSDHVRLVVFGAGELDEAYKALVAWKTYLADYFNGHLPDTGAGEVYDLYYGGTSV